MPVGAVLRPDSVAIMAPGAIAVPNGSFWGEDVIVIIGLDVCMPVCSIVLVVADTVVCTAGGVGGRSANPAGAVQSSPGANWSRWASTH